LGQKPITTSETEMGAAPHPGSLDYDVTGRVAAANYKHPLSLQLIGMLVIFRVHQLSSKLSFITRPAPIPVVPVASNHPFVTMRLAGAQPDRPESPFNRRNMLHPGVEDYVFVQIIVLRIFGYIFQHLRRAGKIGIVRRHWMVGELCGLAR